MSEEGDLTADQLARIANISVILAMERYVYTVYTIFILYANIFCIDYLLQRMQAGYVEIIPWKD